MVCFIACRGRPSAIDRKRVQATPRCAVFPATAPPTAPPTAKPYPQPSHTHTPTAATKRHTRHPLCLVASSGHALPHHGHQIHTRRWPKRQPVGERGRACCCACCFSSTVLPISMRRCGLPPPPFALPFCGGSCQTRHNRRFSPKQQTERRFHSAVAASVRRVWRWPLDTGRSGLGLITCPKLSGESPRINRAKRL